MTSKEVEKYICEEHSKIATMASRITMRYEHRNVDIDIQSVWQYIAPSVESIECALNDTDCTVINVKFSNGGVIRKHKHDRQEEIFVVAGKIYDSVSGVTTEQGERYIIPKNTSHEIISDFARLTVVFRPPFPKVEVENEPNS